MAEHILDVLRHGVGRARERAEGRDVNEVLFIEHAHVQVAWLKAHGALRRERGIGGNGQACREVVRTAAGQVAQRRTLLPRQAHDAVDRLVERAVSAVADDEIEISAEALGQLGRVAVPPRLRHADQIARLGEDRNGVEQRCARFRLARAGIDDKQQLLFHSIHPFCERKKFEDSVNFSIAQKLCYCNSAIIIVC